MPLIVIAVSVIVTCATKQEPPESDTLKAVKEMVRGNAKPSGL
jgi:hypothetical protein